MRYAVLLLAMSSFVAAPAFGSGALGAQDASGRFRVLVPDLFSTGGQDRGFGRDVAKELRSALATLATHSAIEEGEIKDALKQYKLDMEELDCTTTRQLGSLMRAQVVLCASYQAVGDERALHDIVFVELGSAQEFSVEGFTVHKDGQREAAGRIVSAFDTYTQQLRFRRFCIEDAQSANWQGSLRNCDDALALNPADAVVMYQRAFTLWKLDRSQEAYDQLEALLEVDPYHEEGLQLAGYVAAAQGDREAGRSHYSRYLELDPGNVAVRRRIAYEMFEAGDAEGAMLLIERGLEGEARLALLGDYGNYAFEAGRRALPEGPMTAGDVLPPHAAELFRRAITAYTELYRERGDSVSGTQLRNIVLGHMRLGQVEDAASFARQALETHPDDPALWSVYGTALERQERTLEALEALDRVEALDPAYPNLHVRRGALYLKAGRRDDALAALRRAVERGQDPNVAATQIFVDAFRKGLDPQNAQRDLVYGIAGMEAAGEFQVSPETRSRLNFWHAYGLYMRGIAIEAPGTVESARQALPLFQAALPRFREGAAYAATEPSITLQDFLDNTQQYIERQEAIIRRGGSSQRR